MPPNDNVGSGVTSGNLVGSWEMISLNYNVTTVQGIDVSASFVGHGSDYNYVMGFSEAPNNYSSVGTYDIELATTISGQTSVSNSDDLNSASNGTWEKNANVLTFTNASNNNEVSDATIDILSDTNLKFTSSITKNIFQQGVNVVTTTNSVTIFKKL